MRGRLTDSSAGVLALGGICQTDTISL